MSMGTAYNLLRLLLLISLQPGVHSSSSSSLSSLRFVTFRLFAFFFIVLVFTLKPVLAKYPYRTYDTISSIFS